MPTYLYAQSVSAKQKKNTAMYVPPAQYTENKNEPQCHGDTPGGF